MLLRCFCIAGGLFRGLCTAVFFSQALTETENSIRERAGNMTAGENTVPTANNWADDIDDLNREAMERYLEAISSTRARRLVVKTEVGDDQLSGGKSGQRGPSAGGVPR
jgi:hypothetical protein